MATRVVVMTPSRRSILQQSNIILDEKENQSTYMARKEECQVDSDTDDWRPIKKKADYVTNSDNGHLRRRHHKSSVPSTPTPPAHLIARRNERERNRVRQVNESFSELRNRIPVYLYETETDEKVRQTRKKLSKVETLRLAVQYIHRLEGLLNINPERYDSEDFDDEDIMDGGSYKTEGQSDREGDILDLSRDGKSSDEDSADIDDKNNLNSLLREEYSFESPTTSFDSVVKSEHCDLSSDASTSPLPTISSSFPVNLNYSELYANYNPISK